MSTQVKAIVFYCPASKSSSLRIQITYPSISNLSYNFQMKLQLSIQKLLPKISYEKVHEQTFLIAKKQVIVQHLQPSKMYQVVVSWSKKGSTMSQGIQEQKTVFVCSEKLPEGEDEIEEEVSDESYGQYVKGNIQGYFDQYYQKDESAVSQKSNSSSFKGSNESNYQQRPFSSKNKQKNSQKTPFCNSQSMIKAIGSSDPFINNNNLQKYILQGRKSSSIKEYLTTKDFQCFDSFNKLHKNQAERRKHVEKTLLVSKAMNMFTQIYSFEKEHGGLTEMNQNSELNKGKEFFRNDWFMGPFYSYDANERQMKKKNGANEGNGDVGSD